MTWNEGDKTRHFWSDEDRPRRPKPDIYFAIRIRDDVAQPKGFLRYEYSFLQNFTLDSLSACKGLRYSPSADPKKDRENYHHHRVCFPFAVVETKHQNAGEYRTEECYCQAANASSTALAMLCNLSKYVQGAQCWWGKNNGVLPVVSFTFIGYNVKLWISYVSNYNCDSGKSDIHQYVSCCLPQTFSDMRANFNFRRCAAFGGETLKKSGMLCDCAASSTTWNIGSSGYTDLGYLGVWTSGAIKGYGISRALRTKRK